MKDKDFKILRDALDTLQVTVDGAAVLNAQAQAKVEQKLEAIESRLDEIDLVHENLIGEIRQLNKNVEDLKDD